MRPFENAPRWLAMAGLGLLLAACGGGGSDGANSSGENQAPTASVQFPLSGSLTTGTEITVRGTATDPGGDAITAVTVHGVLAETNDGFATWKVPNVPLQTGTQSLEGVVQNAQGGVGRFSLTLERGENPGPALSDPRGLAFDDSGSEPRLLVVDSGLDALFAVDLSNGPALGHRTILGQTGDGNGVDFDGPEQVVVDSAENRALVVDEGVTGTDKVITVDLATQERTELVSGLSGPESLALDATNNRLLIGDVVGNKLLTLNLDDPAAGTTDIVSINAPVSIDLDPADPDRALVVDTDFRVKALFEVDVAGKTNREVTTFGNFPESVAFDPAGGSELAVVTDSDHVFSVNIADGSKTVLSGRDGDGTMVGKGSRFGEIRDILFDPRDANRLWVAEQDNDAVFVVDMASGDRIALGSRLGNGPDFLAPAAVALVPNAGTGQPMAVVLDAIFNSGSYEIYGVKLTPGDAFGDRVTLSGYDSDNPNQPRGQGPALGRPQDLVADTANNRLLVADSDLEAVVAVDPESGDRAILSGDGVGDGPALDGIRSLALDAANNRVLVAQRGGLVAVDLDNGDRTLISTWDGSAETDTGTGPEIFEPLAIALDARNNRLLVLDNNGRLELELDEEEEPGRLMSVNLSSGDRTVVTDSATGSGNRFVRPVSVALDAANNRALILESQNDQSSVVAVDLDSGDRSVISGHDLGPDGEFDSGDDQYIGGGSPFNPTSSLTDAAFDAEAGVLYVTDEGTSSLIAVDVASGDRVLVSGFEF